jgi:2-aminoadipate transaminase
MPLASSLSAAAQRAGHSAISDLMACALTSPDLISLAAGFVDTASLPVGAAARAAVGVLSNPVDGRRSLQYGTTQGDIGLRTKLMRRLEDQEGMPDGTWQGAIERMVVTTGSQQLLYLVAETLLDPGDIVLVESPSYFVFLGVLQARGARAVGVEVDEGGLRIDALENQLAAIEARGELDRVKLIYTVPDHSNPTGLSLEAERRSALLEVARAWSKHCRIYILEDAAYRGLTYEGLEPPSLWSHDTAGDTVILARTFSKTFSPGLKTGYGVVPESLIKPLLTLKGCHDFGSSHFNQQILGQVISDGSYDEQVEALRQAYDKKRKATLGALDEHFGSLDAGISWTKPKGGLYVWSTLPAEIDTGWNSPFFQQCLQLGVLYVPGSYAFPVEPVAPPVSCMRLSFGMINEQGIGEGIRRLSQAFQIVSLASKRDQTRSARLTVSTP